MRLSGVLLPILIAFSAAIYGIFVGRAQGSRMREVRGDILAGNLRGSLVILAVIFAVLASLVW